jgi:hypothetical protein
LTTAACATIAPTVTGNREHDRADPELDGRVAEHLLRVEREDERHATATAPVSSITRFAPTSVRERQEAERHERRRVARLDQREGGKEHGRAGDEEDRLRVAQPTSGASTTA